jgi:hypothetical protein
MGARPTKSTGVLIQKRAMRVVFFYPGEEGTYVDNPQVTLFENGMVHLRNAEEVTTTHINHCEIQWTYPVEKETPTLGLVRALIKNKEDDIDGM